MEGKEGSERPVKSVKPRASKVASSHLSMNSAKTLQGPWLRHCSWAVYRAVKTVLPHKIAAARIADSSSEPQTDAAAGNSRESGAPRCRAAAGHRNSFTTVYWAIITLGDGGWATMMNECNQ